MLRPCESDYNLTRHLIPFLQDNAFYAEISRHVQKKFTYDLPTMAVTFDEKADELVMWVNPCFMAGGTYKNCKGKDVTEEGLTDWETRGGITHEFDHLVYGHLNARRQPIEFADDWNIGTDLAIDSLIVQRAGQPKDAEPGKVVRSLPKIALVPGQRPYIDPAKYAALEPWRQKAVDHLSDLIQSFPPSKASEWYFNRILEDKQKNPEMYPKGGLAEIGIGPMDDHGGWGEVPEELREYIEGRIKAVIEKAVRHADQMDGWGNIPAELREEIRRSVSTIVDWRSVLRQFTGNLIRARRSTSIKRINRRYPYIHPGLKRGYTAKLIIAIDESGSVFEEMLNMFFSELDTLTRKVDITLLHFDCHTSVKDLYEWKKGARPKLNRVRGGGTNFDAPTNFVNDPKNRGRWDGMLIMTDGQAPKPGPSRIKRGWVLGQGCKLEFPSDEIQIFLSKDRAMTGAWR